MNTEQISNQTQFIIVLFGLTFSLTFEQWISLGVLITGVISMLHGIYTRRKNTKLREREIAIAEQELQLKTNQAASGGHAKPQSRSNNHGR